MTSSFDFSKIKAIVFDWDGTLLDSTGAISTSIQEAAADLKLPVPTREQASHVIGLALPNALKTAVPEVSTTQLPELIERYKFHYTKRDSSLYPFEGIPEMLDTLIAMGIPLAIATGKSTIGLIRALENLSWRGKFVSTRCADQGEPKPHPWMLLDICEELHIEPYEALMIGDTTHDLGLAKNAGSPSVAVSYGAHPESGFAAFSPVETFSKVQGLANWLINGFKPQAQSKTDSENEICLSDDLMEKGYGNRFTMADGRQAFVIRFDGQVKGYINECRHLPTELDWNFGHFLDADKEHLVCATHGALYDPLSGLCVAGPCRGRSLEAVEIEEIQGKIVLKTNKVNYEY
jgi:phosphoglycolate phosphatase